MSRKSVVFDLAPNDWVEVKGTQIRGRTAIRGRVTFCAVNQYGAHMYCVDWDKPDGTFEERWFPAEALHLLDGVPQPLGRAADPDT